MLIYGDNIILAGPCSHSINKLLQALKVDFAHKDLGTLNYFLGVEVVPVSSGLLLSLSTSMVYLKKLSY